MRAVSACSSFRNQLPSRRQAGMPAWTVSPWALQFPVSRLGSGGGREEGSKAGSRVSGGEVGILDGAEVCLRGCWSMALSCLLGRVVFAVWLLVQLAVLLTVGVVSWGSWGSVSVFCLEAMLLSRLRLQRHAQTSASDSAGLNSDVSNTFHGESFRTAGLNGIMMVQERRHTVGRILSRRELETNQVYNSKSLRTAGFRDNEQRKGSGLSNKCN